MAAAVARYSAYTVVQRDDVGSLQNNANDLVRQGWVPLGGVSCNVIKYDREDRSATIRYEATKYSYVQAMVKY